MRFIAIDWSGDKTTAGQRKKIWIADSNQGDVTLTNGRTRQEIADYLIAAASQTPRLIAGLDFAFSYPAWFVREQDCATAEQFWQLVADGKGEEWLTQPNKFCWGRKGVRCPSNHREPGWHGFRRTDREFDIAGIQPKSPFQIAGAGAVGTGSLRGIPILYRLKEAGFSIWPFTHSHLPVVLEIYPRLFTGPGNKSSKDVRTQRLSRFKGLPRDVLTKAEESDDAFDALCSLIGLRELAGEFANLEQATDKIALLEGQIWRPTTQP